MAKKVKNQEIKISKTEEMNDRDYLNDVLESMKNLAVNMTTMLNEASNEQLYKKLFPMYANVKQGQRDLYEIAFAKGFYVLEEAEETKLGEKHDELKTLLDEFKK